MYMSDKNAIFVIESNDFAGKQLQKALDRYGIGDCAVIVQEPPESAESTVISPVKPIRVGRVLDQIASLIASQERGSGMLDLMSGRSVDTMQGYYYSGAGKDPIKLTEKEVAVLVLLEREKGQAVSREALLENVWQYAEGVETHTLETHIYRLRQKIEEDPAQPKILQTSEAGYFLAIE